MLEGKCSFPKEQSFISRNVFLGNVNRLELAHKVGHSWSDFIKLIKVCSHWIIIAVVSKVKELQNVLESVSRYHSVEHRALQKGICGPVI